MNIHHAVHAAKVELSKAGLRETWTVAVDNARRRCGMCCYTTRTISLSQHFIVANDRAQVMDTIWHEIAHALAGPEAGHGPEWVAIAKSLGCNGERLAGDDVTMPKPPFEAVCTGCGKVTRRRHRRHSLANRYHTPCGPESKLKWRRTHD